MPYKPIMPPKLNAIYLLGEDKKYALVKLNDGRVIQCRADCYFYIGDDNDEDLDVLALHVFYKGFDSGEILVENDIVSVEELVEWESLNY